MGVLPAEIVKITAHAMCFITVRQRSCGKVMFLQVSDCPRGVDGISGPMSFPGVCGYLWYQVPSVGVGMSTGWSMSREESTHPPDMGSNGIWSTSGGYASYWNAFLLLLEWSLELMSNKDQKYQKG